MISNALRAPDRIRPPRAMGYRACQALEYIRAVLVEQGSAPSYAMIRDHLGLADNGQVRLIVMRLENRGLLRRSGTGRVRRIRLVVDAH